MYQLFLKLIRKLIGSRNDRILKKLRKLVVASNQLEEKISALSDQELQQYTAKFKSQLKDGASLDDIRPTAFAVVREAAVRVLNMRHFDVQLIGALVLHEGKIAEMKTGEGKTLVATLAAYLNALTEKGVHIVTVNDYLARRDGEQMAQLYSFLGLSVGVINSSGAGGPDTSSYLFDATYQPEPGAAGYLRLRPCTRAEAYQADITYGTNNEFGFDYLRDNMVVSLADKAQRELNYAIIDEVDSILIDEARTPLIISGPTSDNSALYQVMNTIAPKLKKATGQVSAEGVEPEGDFIVDEKSKSISLTEQGHANLEAIMVEAKILAQGSSLYDPSNIAIMHHMDAALRAHHVFLKDVNYVVEGQEVIIVDEFTGRKMPGRRWSDGLHQAVEAKENVEIRNENQTLAAITYQNYFRLYHKLSGMTGTADTEAHELLQIYKLEVVVIPTNKPMIRDDKADLMYRNADDKYAAIVADIKDCMQRKQPVLIGTATIESSETLHNVLQKNKIKHEVLNAKQHEREAHIVAQAGKPKAVTIATNMAGRGTDIVLGGNLEAEIDALKEPSEQQIQAIKQAWQQRHQQVLDAGGLHIIGSERHESRRIDNQLRGRAGRQGDPGSTRFYLSPDDNLMRIFTPENVKNLMQRMLQDGEGISHPWLNRAIENAQRKVEGHNYDVRKNTLEYDDVANDQRKIIYEQRNELLAENEHEAMIKSMRREVVENLVYYHIPANSMQEQWDITGLQMRLIEMFGVNLPLEQLIEQDDLYEEDVIKLILNALEKDYSAKFDEIDAENIARFEKQVLMWVFDTVWKEHLASMDYLKQGIGMRAYAQKDPKQEYKKESFHMFSDMLETMKSEMISKLHLLQIRTQQEIDAIEEKNQQQSELNYSDQQQQDSPRRQEPHRRSKKIGRNQPCPCNSGKKYKQCCGKL